MYYRKTLLLACFLLVTVTSYSQVLDFIDIHLNIREKVGENTQALPNAKLKISDIGPTDTDEEGNVNFRYAIRNNVDPEISIALISDQHKLLKPLDGSVAVDPTREEMFIDLVVVNMAEESEAFKKRISELESRISSLKRKNAYTKQQLNKMNDILLDTILYFETIRNQLEDEKAELENLSEEQKGIIASQQASIDSLNDQVSELTFRLTEALEERYLRQNEYFKDISSNLTLYLSTAKDLKDHLPYIKTYYNSPGGFQGLDRDAKRYGEVFLEIQSREQEFLEGVGRYWENPPLQKELEDVFDLLLKGIHLNQIRPVLNGVFDEIRKQRPGKAQKIATNAHENITINILDLEKRINRILVKLRNN